MNSNTLNLIERPYQEIVDDILTAIVGGVVNEPIFFDVKIFDYSLAEPARDVRGITGTRNKERHAFQKGIDFEYSEGDNAVIWQEGGALPDDETIFYVDYFRQNSRSPLTDINIGSVTRTLGEAIGREIATVYQQINLAYLSAFIDSAQGKSLDLVVAILGIRRKTKDFATGLVTFFRDPGIPGNITIPEGVALTTTKDEVRFQSVEPRTLQRGQVRIDAPVRAGEEFKGDVGKVDSGTITELMQPIAGITRVTNFEATILSAEDETDAQLRLRAKAVLRALGKATLAALEQVILEGRATKLLELRDPNSPPIKRTDPGEVILLIEAEPERFPSLRGGVEETRAAGVLSTIIARYIFFTPRITATITPGLTAPGKDKVIEEIIAAFQKFIDDLSSGKPFVAEEFLKSEALKELADVSEIRFVDAITFRTDIVRPGAEGLVESLLNAFKAAPGADDDTLRAALSAVLTEEAPPVSTGNRVPDRSLVQGESGARATDEEIETAKFTVVAKIEGEDWWIVLDMKPADIVLQEGGG